MAPENRSSTRAVLLAALIAVTLASPGFADSDFASTGALTQVADDDMEARRFDVNELLGLANITGGAEGEPGLSCVNEVLSDDGAGRKGVKFEASGTVAEVDPATLAVRRQRTLPVRRLRTGKGGYAAYTWNNTDLNDFWGRPGTYIYSVRSRALGRKAARKIRTLCRLARRRQCATSPTVACFGGNRYSATAFYRAPGTTTFQPAQILSRTPSRLSWYFTSRREEVRTRISDLCRRASRSYEIENTQITPWEHKFVITDTATGWMWTVPRSDYVGGAWRRNFPGCTK